MSQTVLYRKYRPQNFDAVIGQDHIVSLLKTAITSNTLAHAYLLTGGRGIGKTTVARIIAKELGTSPNDLYEIDAASNNGVDDIRQLRENIGTLPFDSKYKVYILDEVHMLSKPAFNALLKTLEEPPSHVVFILATTEIEKVPETIVSRCQVLTFKKPSESLLKVVVEKIAKEEGKTLEPGVAELIALLGDGSFRDTQGILDKVLSATAGNTITLAHAEKTTGAPAVSLVAGYLGGLVEGNIEMAIDAVALAREQNYDMRIYFLLILRLFRHVLLVRVAPQTARVLDLSGKEQEFLESALARNPKIFTSANLLTLLKMFELIKVSSIAGLPLELACLEILGDEKKQIFPR